MSFEAWANLRRDPDVLKTARAARLSEPELTARVEAEAAGNATWARRSPGAAGVGDLTLQADKALAIAAAFVLTP